MGCRWKLQRGARCPLVSSNTHHLAQLRTSHCVLADHEAHLCSSCTKTGALGWQQRDLSQSAAITRQYLALVTHHLRQEPHPVPQASGFRRVHSPHLARTPHTRRGSCLPRCAARQSLTGRSTGGATAGRLARAALFVYAAPRGQGVLPCLPGYLYVRPQKQLSLPSQ